MPTNFEITDKMAYSMGGGVPWHREGEAVDGSVTFKASGLDWESETVPVEAVMPDDSRIIIPDRLATIRKDTGTVLGIVSDHYQVIQNETMWMIIPRAFSAAGVEFFIETAGSLRGGRDVWALAKAPDLGFEIAGQDRHETYFLISSSHDGSSALEGRPTNVRVVCGNTFSMARSTRATNRVLHKGDVESAIRNLRDDITKSIKSVAEFQSEIEGLVDFTLNPEITQEFTNIMWPPIVQEGDKNNEKAIANRLRHIDVFKNVFKQESTRFGPTAYSLFNAYTGYADHARPYLPRSEEQRFSANILGAWNDNKRKALKTVRALVTA